MPSITNGMQEMEERISGIEDTIKETDTSAKENVKCNKFLTKKNPEIWDAMKRSNQRIIGIVGEESQSKGTENIFNKII